MVRHGGAQGSRALLGYVAGWIAVGALAAAMLIWILPDDRGERALPPVRETELATAVRAAGCMLRTGRAGDQPRQPAVEGPRTTAPRPGVYDHELPDDQLVTAMRRGIVVIRYRTGLDDEDVATLEGLQAAVPNGTVVTVDSGLPFALGATAWRHVLACPALNDRAVDAIRLFRGRYLGAGPDSPR